MEKKTAESDPQAFQVLCLQSSTRFMVRFEQFIVGIQKSGSELAKSPMLAAIGRGVTSQIELNQKALGDERLDLATLEEGQPDTPEALPARKELHEGSGEEGNSPSEAVG